MSAAPPAPPSATKATVLPDLDPQWGGTSVSVPALCEAMHALDPAVRLYFAADETAAAWPAWYEPHPKSPPAGLHASRSLRRALLARELAVVHHHALWLPSLGYAHRAARRWACPLVISPRGMLAPYALRRARAKKWLASRLLHPGALTGAAAWHATSELEFSDIRAAGFRQPIFVSPNGIRRPAWSEPADRQAWLARYPALRGRRVCLFFSRLHSKKGLFPLLEWWAQARCRQGWHLLVAGSPHEYNLAQVQRQADQLGLHDAVTVADPRGLAKPYPLAQLYVLPTQSENFGLSIGEALSAGVPVLTTTEAPWQRVNELGCGACVPLAQFAARLEEMLALAPETLAHMGRSGRAWIEAEFSWADRGRDMLDFYATLPRA